MSDFVAFSEDIEAGMEFLEHHQILGAKWGVMNGPPYPLGSGDHSSSEKAAAKEAGIKVGSDSGEGSIENVQKKKKKAPAQNKPKKELTPEEKRDAALEAARQGDKKKITKYMDQLSTDELRDAQARSQMRDSLSKKDPQDQKTSKAEMEKLEAIRSGDKEKVRQYANQMSYAELAEAMNKIDLTARLNFEPPPPSTMDKVRDVANKLGTFKDVAEKSIGAYNVVAKVVNAANKDAKWPIIGEKEKDKDKEKDKEKEKEKEQMKEGAKKVVEGVVKSYEEQAKENYENKKTDYKYNQKFEKWKDKQDKKNPSKDEDSEEPSKQATKPAEQPKYERKEGEGEDARYFYKEDTQPKQEQSSVVQPPTRSEKFRYANQNRADDEPYRATSSNPVKTKDQSIFNPGLERGPKATKATFNTKKQESNDEPTEEQKRLVNEARKSDEQYLNRMKTVSQTKMSESKDTPSYDEIMTDTAKEPMRQSYQRAVKMVEDDDYYQRLYENLYDND